MKLSTKTRYGLRFLSETSRFYGIRTTSLKEIAHNQDLSLKYLSQIVIPLRNAGLITAVRGNTGGYALAKPPIEITLREIFEILEGGVDLVDCLDDEIPCGRESACPTQWVWKGLSKTMATYLDGITLEEIRMKLVENEAIDYSI